MAKYAGRREREVGGTKLYVCQQEPTISGLPLAAKMLTESLGANNEWGSRVAHKLFDLISTLDHCLDAVEVGESLSRL